MPAFSAFARFGHLRFSAKKTEAQIIYERMVAAVGGEEMVADGGYGIDTALHARIYAHAMALATAKRNFDRVLGNENPTTSVELLSYHERDYGLAPLPEDTDDQRRAALEVAQRVAEGCRHDVLHGAMSELLGDDLVAVRLLDATEYTVYPSNWSTPATRPGTWKRSDVVAKRRTLDASVSTIGESTVATTYLGGSSEMFAIGDTLVVEPGLVGRQEAATVSGVTGDSFTANFTKPHPAGSIVSTEPWPTAASSSRNVIIVATSAVARSSAWRKKVGARLRGLLRVVDSWELVEEYSAGQLGPFIPGEGIPGVTPVVQLSTTP